MKESYSIPGCRVERSDSTQSIFVVRTERRGAPCPSCKQYSDAPHSTYVRRPADLPSAGRAVQLELHVRRFSCRNAKCERSTFGEYARAAAQGAPQAQQVADRWHLLLNGRQMMERWLTGAHARLCALPEVLSATSAPVRRHASFPRIHSEARAREESRARRVAVYQAMRRRHLAGEPLLRISHTLRLARGTVRKYASAPSFPERAARVPAPSLLDPYLEYLAQRHTEGCENALALWREIRAQGFEGTSRQVHRWLQTRRRAVARPTPRSRSGNDSSPSLPRPSGALPSPK